MPISPVYPNGENTLELTHGNTYQEAIDNAQEVLEDLVDIYTEENKPLPSPKLLQLAEKITND